MRDLQGGKGRGLAIVVFSLTIAAVLVAPLAAYGEGYNDGAWNFTREISETGYGENAGIYVRDPESGSQIRLLMGPHGDYNTTTNKCQDCHSTHYALGSYMLLRSNDRENACSFCHAGGGGSATNIQMDNAYDEDGVIPAADMGPGTGHTLGYKGPTAADIYPAYQSEDGFACFDCHTPHGNSARVLTTFMDPGRKMGGTSRSGAVLVTHLYDAAGLIAEDPLGIDLRGVDFQVGGAYETGSYYGLDPVEGNFVTVEDGQIQPEPVWPSGRFLLLKNPHQEPHDDTVLGAHPGMDEYGDEGKNKIRIDWDSPIGLGFHIDGLDGDPDDGDPTDDDLRFLTMSEYCADCHDGAMGQSTHQARVWYPQSTNTGTGSYVDAYHHDSNPRLRDDMMFLHPTDELDVAPGEDPSSVNYGNHCRKCHIGGSTCRQCHGVTPDGTIGYAYEKLMSPYDLPSARSEHMTAYWAQPYVSRFAIPDVTIGLDTQCIDGGFSWPHRTLGINLLKDELYGVDFDGTPVKAGGVRRMTAPEIDSYFGLAVGEYFGLSANQASEVATDAWRPSSDDTYSILGQTAENLDSMCLDCHGDATHWNGDDPANYYIDDKGWELLLKGLP